MVLGILRLRRSSCRRLLDREWHGHVVLFATGGAQLTLSSSSCSDAIQLAESDSRNTESGRRGNRSTSTVGGCLNFNNQ